MKITDIDGLWVAVNKDENFTALVSAFDCNEALQIAQNYFLKSNVSAENIEIEEFRDIDTVFDCDYILNLSV